MFDHSSIGSFVTHNKIINLSYQSPMRMYVCIIRFPKIYTGGYPIFFL